MTLNQAHPPIAILSYAGAQQSAVYGLVDMFEAAQSFGAIHLKPLILNEQQALSHEGQLAAIILPPCLEKSFPTLPASSNQWLKHHHEQGALLCSICVGAVLLAQAQVLDHRPATTHWAITQEFAERFPLVQLDTDRLVVDDGDILTAGGVMAWADLGLRLIDRFAGHAIMLDVARRFLIDPAGREQKVYRTFYPNLTHGDTSVLKAQHYLQKSFREKISVPQIAEKAGLTPRTFLRRFERATGHTPNEYLQQLRIAEARRLLEQTRSSFNEIAWSLGYEDPTAFRKIFNKRLGISPGEYRKRFGSL